MKQTRKNLKELFLQSRESHYGRKVEHFLYYAFLIGTVGFTILFIPLHSRALRNEGDEKIPSSHAITHRDTNSTGEYDSQFAQSEQDLVIPLETTLRVIFNTERLE